MPLYSLDGKSPSVHPEAFVAPTACLIGDVTVEAGVSIWFNTVIRADYAPIIIRAGANIQDGSVLHSDPGMPVDIGEGATVAHMCLVHSCTVGDGALIGNHATVLDGASIGARSMVAAGSLVLGGAQMPEDVLVMGSPAKVKGPVAGTPAEFLTKGVPAAYRELGKRYLAGLGK
ncbi:gamma carbonic anhydrase family protein [Mycobacteroides abscessus]|uniref:gamma carbonic anhydrase family protein n=1 Tax=Mycobacteroides abscessus TaxID=36809 RepID=UPI00266B596D|nr:gamma carbonic anhydrase family protein [Mycobacteroides abscessus]MDO2971613.1 gamma carbonic anhydrase family protein [Mycobacteroides abscessus subsp. bolletii]MDO3076690.1 gamma carbonic anhydrase family protein [Mycobacteroides abscessus subsp. bolletii]